MFINLSPNSLDVVISSTFQPVLVVVVAMNNIFPEVNLKGFPPR